MMTRRKPVGPICWPSDSGSWDEEGPKFIRCVDRRDPYIQKVWTFGEDSGMHEVHMTARVDFNTGFVGEFATDYLNPSWRRVSVFGVNPIYGRVQYLGVPFLMMTYGHPWTNNILDPSPSWGTGGTATNTN